MTWNYFCDINITIKEMGCLCYLYNIIIIFLNEQFFFLRKWEMIPWQLVKIKCIIFVRIIMFSINIFFNGTLIISFLDSYIYL